jgi:hypothetical protein
MTHIDLATIAHASRSVMAYEISDRPTRVGKLMTATLPAVGILAACAMVFFAII